MLFRRRGFTLIEILCTVTILAIAAMAAMPLFGNGNADVKLSADTRSVMGDIFYAQNMAMSTQQPVYLLFIPVGTAGGTPGGSYWLLTRNADGTTYTLQDRPGGYQFTVYLGQIGAANQRSGTRLPDAQLNSVKQGGNAISTVTLAKIVYGTTSPVTLQTNVTGVLLGFDTFGQPFIGVDATSTAGKLGATGTIELAAPSNGNLKATLSLEPFTGELTVN
jgi:prepilin-type N-terminal cleavage/methylation domain-containing protein